jgi:hypothetical protein
MGKRKDVSVLVSAAGWTGSLVERIVSALHEKGVSDEEIHALVVEDNSALLNKITDAIAEFAEQMKRIYAVTVDFGMSIEDLLTFGKYDWVSSDITSGHLPTKRVGKMETTIEFIHFGRNISSDDALKELDQMGYRPAEAHELLAFGAKYPGVQREFPIVALGSFWRESNSIRRVVCLYRRAMERRAGLCWFEGGWDGSWRFAAVKK